ncbi:zinc-binding dehydrogenase [Streptomyces lydicus]|uniref:zinc-binding dehydrogenase n=1 Tax=Streptomyces lydicus TaxID=47763 RepID=UPI0036CB924B
MVPGSANYCKRGASRSGGGGGVRDMADHVASGALRPVIDSVYPPADIASLHQAVERGGVVGKQVVAVSGRQEAPGSGSRVPVTTGLRFPGSRDDRAQVPGFR